MSGTPRPALSESHAVIHNYKSDEATSSGECSNAAAVGGCPEPSVFATPTSGSPSGFPSHVVLWSDVPDAIIHYTIDGTEPDSLSTVYTDPISVTSSGVTIHAVAHTEGCPLGPSITVQYANPQFPFVFSYSCDTPDHAGPWDDFTSNGINDHHWVLQFTLAAATTIKRLELYQLDASGNWTTGQVWSTDSPIVPTDYDPESPPGIDFFCYPLVVFIAAVQQWVAYQDTLGSYGAGSHTWDLYGDTVVAAGGLFRLDIILGDDTKLTQSIEAVCTSAPPLCPPPAAPTLLAKCDGAVDVTFAGTVGRPYQIYQSSTICDTGAWTLAASGTIDASPKTVEITGLTAGCVYSFYVSVDEVGCGFRDSNPASVTPLSEPTVIISTNKTIVEPNESFTISWTSNNIGGAVCGGCLDGQVSINQSMGCKAGNVSGSQAQTQAVCGIYTYQITGCNTCGTAVASVQVEVRCPTICPNCNDTPSPATVHIANPMSFLCPVDDWCCKNPVVCGQPDCGPGSAYQIGQFPSYVAWDGVLFPLSRSACTYVTQQSVTGNTYLGGCPGPTPGTAYPILVSITCQAQQGKWFLGIQSENGSASGCFGNWWQGEKLTGNGPTGVYTRVSGCSTHPASITVT